MQITNLLTSIDNDISFDMYIEYIFKDIKLSINNKYKNQYYISKLFFGHETEIMHFIVDKSTSIIYVDIYLYPKKCLDVVNLLKSKEKYKDYEIILKFH